MDVLIIFCAKYLIYVVALGALVYVYFAPNWKRYGILAALSLLLSVAVGKLLGLMWYDTLPFVINGTQPLFEHAANNGFPSDHTLVAAALASAVFVYNRTWGLMLWVLALLVGLARVCAGVHHPIDIIAGAAVAVAVTALVAYTLGRLYPSLSSPVQ